MSDHSDTYLQLQEEVDRILTEQRALLAAVYADWDPQLFRAYHRDMHATWSAFKGTLEAAKDSMQDTEFATLMQVSGDHVTHHLEGSSG